MAKAATPIKRKFKVLVEITMADHRGSTDKAAVLALENVIRFGREALERGQYFNRNECVKVTCKSYKRHIAARRRLRMIIKGARTGVWRQRRRQF